MLKPGILRAVTLLSAAGLLCVASNARADLAGRGKPRKTTAATSRAQSPMYEPTPAGGGSWQQSAPSTTPWYQANSYEAQQDCCGPYVKHTWWKDLCRKKCGQTFYCSTPPYCMPCYGFNNSCWRRTGECTICPRESLPIPSEPRRPLPAKIERKGPPPAATAPPDAGDGALPPDAGEGTPPEPQSLRRRGRPLEVAPVSSERPSTDRSRWTGFADALGETDEIPEAPLDTPAEYEGEDRAVEGAEESEVELEVAPLSE